MATELRTTYCGDQIAVKADWAQAASNVFALDAEGEWICTQFQVAYFRHDPRAALRRELEEYTRVGGYDPADYEAEIDAAVDDAVETVSD